MLIERNLDASQFAVEDLAGALGMSRRHLTRRMNEAFGTAPAAYIRARRLHPGPPPTSGPAPCSPRSRRPSPPSPRRWGSGRPPPSRKPSGGPPAGCPRSMPANMSDSPRECRRRPVSIGTNRVADGTCRRSDRNCPTSNIAGPFYRVVAASGTALPASSRPCRTDPLYVPSRSTQPLS